ncbi:MAG: hypothetical protein M3Q65_05925 [Chloroflexota bacterium]|nr:hypothetical protein [Chloroflexota bacterium]
MRGPRPGPRLDGATVGDLAADLRRPQGAYGDVGFDTILWLQDWRQVDREVVKVNPREALTVRFPARLLTRARELKSDRESLNDFVIEAVDREVRRRQGLQAYGEILRIRDAVRAQAGLQADSAPVIRSLREGGGRRA